MPVENVTYFGCSQSKGGHNEQFSGWHSFGADTDQSHGVPYDILHRSLRRVLLQLLDWTSTSTLGHAMDRDGESRGSY